MNQIKFILGKRFSHNHNTSSRPDVFCKYVFLKILQISRENTCVSFSFLIKLQASGLQLY